MESIGRPVTIAMPQKYCDIFREHASLKYPFRFARNERDVIALKARGYCPIVQVNGLEEFHKERREGILPPYVDVVLESFREYADLEKTAGMILATAPFTVLCGCYFSTKWPNDDSKESVLLTMLGDLKYIKHTTNAFDAASREPMCVKETRAIVKVIVRDVESIPDMGIAYDKEDSDWFMSPTLLGAPEGWHVRVCTQTAETRGEVPYIKGIQIVPVGVEVGDASFVSTLDLSQVSAKDARRMLLVKIAEIESLIH